MIKTALFSFFLFLSITLSGQTVAVTVSDVKVSDTQFKSTGILIKERVEKTLLEHDFITLVDRDLTYMTEAEREVQKKASFMDGKFVKQDKAIGAEWIFEMLFDEEDEVLTLQILDVETDEIFFGKDYEIKHFLTKKLKVERPNYFGRYIEEKVGEMMLDLDVGSRNVINIIEITNAKKNKAEEVLVFCPEACNLKRKMKLEVFKESPSETGSYTKKTKIGLVEIIYIESDKIYQAKVKKGQKEIFKSFNQKDKLICKNEI